MYIYVIYYRCEQIFKIIINWKGHPSTRKKKKGHLKGFHPFEPKQKKNTKETQTNKIKIVIQKDQNNKDDEYENLFDNILDQSILSSNNNDLDIRNDDEEEDESDDDDDDESDENNTFDMSYSKLPSQNISRIIYEDNDNEEDNIMDNCYHLSSRIYSSSDSEHDDDL